MSDSIQIEPNIYAQWYGILKATGRGAAMKPMKGLQSLSLTEIKSLKDLLNAELKIRREAPSVES